MKGVTQDSRVLYRAMRMTIELVDKLEARNQLLEERIGKLENLEHEVKLLRATTDLVEIAIHDLVKSGDND